MAAGDLHSRRIPNYLTFGGALAGLVFQTAVLGWPGFVQSVLGAFLGLALLLPAYILGGMGAGDVKALAALGAWLGPKACFSVFCYMGLAGGVLSLGVLIWKGILWRYLKHGYQLLQNFVFCRDRRLLLETLPHGSGQTSGLPYGVAIALGMVAYLQWGSLF
jgi:prepilin peptidase CpaA